MTTDEVFELDPQVFRRVLGQFATGVTIVTAMDEGHPVGISANSFTSVSLQPPLVLFCVGRASTTWPRIERARKFAINILSADQEELCRHFAAKHKDRFSKAEWHLGIGGSPVLHETLAYLDCEFWAAYDGGDHIIVVGRILDLDIQRNAPPLLFFRGAFNCARL